MEIRDAPRSPAHEAWDERVVDWLEDGDRILGLGQEYRQHYKEKICSKCSPEQQVRRKCAALSPGCDELECGHMLRAFAKKHDKAISQYLASHPIAVRLSLNAELARTKPH